MQVLLHTTFLCSTLYTYIRICIPSCMDAGLMAHIGPTAKRMCVTETDVGVRSWQSY